MASNTKRITKKYWDSLTEGSRYRALRKVFSNFPNTTNEDYSKKKASELDWMWDIIQRHVKQPVNETHYKTVIDRTWIP